jgi:hypothetical protein
MHCLALSKFEVFDKKVYSYSHSVLCCGGGQLGFPIHRFNENSVRDHQMTINVMFKFN